MGVVFRNVFDVTHLNLEAVKQLALICAGLQVSDAESKGTSPRCGVERIRGGVRAPGEWMPA